MCEITGGPMQVCAVPDVVSYGCVGDCGCSGCDLLLMLWALLMLLLVLGTALSVLSASRRVSRVERRLDRHVTRYVDKG